MLSSCDNKMKARTVVGRGRRALYVSADLIYNYWEGAREEQCEDNKWESPTYILDEDTQPVIRAIGVSHTAYKDEFR